MRGNDIDRRKLLGAGAAVTLFASAAESVGAEPGDNVPKGMSDGAHSRAIEAIKILKARYFRFVDTKQFDALEALFSPTATLFFPEYQKAPVDVKTAMTQIRDTLEGAISVHYGYMPEIEVLSPTTARGIWGMSDHIWWQDKSAMEASELIGWGHYHETYVRIGGKWVIETLRLSRLRSYTVGLPHRVE